jgi:hypothetical protein
MFLETVILLFRGFVIAEIYFGNPQMVWLLCTEKVVHADARSPHRLTRRLIFQKILFHFALEFAWTFFLWIVEKLGPSPCGVLITPFDKY